MRWFFLGLLFSTCAFAWIDPVLEPLVGVSKRDALDSWRLQISKVGDDYRVRFQITLGQTEVEGVLVDALWEQRQALAEMTDLVPVGPAHSFLRHPDKHYYFVNIEKGRGRYWPAFPSRNFFLPHEVVLEVGEFAGETMVQIYFFERRNAETLRVLQYSGLHMTPERFAARRDGCAFFLAPDFLP